MANQTEDGVVVYFNETKAYGFIRPTIPVGDGGADVFVHLSQVSNADKMKKGAKVEFEIVKVKNGKFAAAHVVVKEERGAKAWV
jgi:cold shock CspA family protein